MEAKSKKNYSSSGERKTGKSCLIFSAMVSSVLVLFILYISANLGSKASEAFQMENFTISDALEALPSPSNNFQAMAQILSQPNQFMAKVLPLPDDLSPSESQQVPWESPTRSTLLTPKVFGLKRGPSLTFLDKGPTVISNKETKPQFLTPDIPLTTLTNNVANKATRVVNGGNFGNNPFFEQVSKDLNGFTQEEMEKDYFEERTEDFDNYDFELPFEGPDPALETAKMDLSELTTSWMENDDDVLLGQVVSSRPKKSNYGLEGTPRPKFDQLVTFKPDHKSDKFGYAQMIDHQDHNHNDYLASASSSSGHDHKPKGGHIAHRNPGPYGYPSPNFKCEYAKETLYVTKTDWTFDKKCFTVFRTKCRQEYESGKGIGFQKECSEFTVTRCRTEYDTDSETKCWTVFRKECFQVYVTKVDWEYEEKCETKHEEVCKGYGYDKHCESVPKEHCHQIPVKVEKQVPRTKCKKVPEKKCQDFPIFIPRKACKDFPKTVCVKDPINVPRKIPKKVCASIPKEVCNRIPVQVIKHVPKTVTKKVCTSTKPSGYTPYSDEASFYPPPSYHDASDYHTSHSNLQKTISLPSGDGEDANIENYFDGVEEVPHFNYE